MEASATAIMFANKPISDICDDEIDSLVRNHTAERRHLEFKGTINYQSDDDRLEVLRDIVSLANSGGGYLVIGIRDDGHGRAQTYEPSLGRDSERMAQSIRALCLDHVADRIDDLEIQHRTVSGNSLVLIRVPESTRVPHMVTFKNRTDFFTRYEDGKREMTLSEIREALSHDYVALRLSHIETLIGGLVASDQDERQRVESLSRLESGTVPHFTQISNTGILAEVMWRRFTDEAKDSPYFRISASPDVLRPNLVSVDRDDVRALLNNPPGSREAGWNMRVRAQRIERFSEGVRHGTKDYQYLELLSNGHMEFWTPLDDNFCWRQAPEEFRLRPRLYPYPVAEYPSSFLRLYRAVADAAGISCGFIVELSYLNVRGYSLAPYAPYVYGRPSPPLGESHIVVPALHVVNDFAPDAVAYELLRPVYAAFGFGADAIPFFVQDQGFDFPS
jgi:hypothetical protein